MCECLLFAALSGVGGLICSSNIDRKGLGMRSFLQGALLPFCADADTQELGLHLYTEDVSTHGIQYLILMLLSSICTTLLVYCIV